MRVPNVIYNMSLLSRMEKAGIIKLHNYTAALGYIIEGPPEFEFENEVYNVKYFEGCTYPFVSLNQEKTRAKNS